jgi:hypothetical protein
MRKPIKISVFWALLNSEAPDFWSRGLRWSEHYARDFGVSTVFYKSMFETTLFTR